MDSVLFNKLTREKNLQLTTMEMYASPYWVVDEKCYSKHYYAGSDRVCSKIGGGFPTGTLSASISANIDNKREEQKTCLRRTASGIMVPQNRTTKIKN